MANSQCHGDLTTCPNSFPPPTVGNTVMSQRSTPTKTALSYHSCDRLDDRVTNIKHVWMRSFSFSPTSLWLPPVFSSCLFSPAGTVYFSHSWRGPSSERPGRCRLSAHSPQHTGKNEEFPPLWSSSFFKRFHSILKKKNNKKAQQT